MKFKAALFYHGFIAYYSFYVIGPSAYKIKLDSYCGQGFPPSLIEVYKAGRNWISTCAEGELIREISAAIEQKSAGHFYY